MWLLLAGCRPAPPDPTPASPRRTTFDGQAAYQAVLQQVEFGFRPSGSKANRQTGDWIIEQLEAAGWQVTEQRFTYLGVECRNILAEMPPSAGSDSEAEGIRPLILLGAHYDTRRQADRDPERPDRPVMGANDGASGTAVLLELAQVLESDKIPYQIGLAFFDAEDNGHLNGWEWAVGSSHMASHLATRPDSVIIVDMIGDADQQIYYEHNSDPTLMQAIWKVAAELGYGDAFIPEYRHSLIDDHTPFARLGIPAVDMIDFDYPYWHTTADTADKVSPDSLARVGRTLEVFLETGGLAGGADE